jgi:hypothetical protein
MNQKYRIKVQVSDGQFSSEKLIRFNNYKGEEVVDIVSRYTLEEDLLPVTLISPVGELDGVPIAFVTWPYCLDPRNATVKVDDLILYDPINMALDALEKYSTRSEWRQVLEKLVQDCKK